MSRRGPTPKYTSEAAKKLAARLVPMFKRHPGATLSVWRNRITGKYKIRDAMDLYTLDLTWIFVWKGRHGFDKSQLDQCVTIAEAWK